MQKFIFMLYFYFSFAMRRCESLEYCATETFQPNCSNHQVVMVKKAAYGRMKVGRCVNHDFGYLGCSADVLGIMDSVCSGYNSCMLHVPNVAFDNLNQCSEDLKSYLNASYECVDVWTSISDGGCGQPEIIKLKDDNLPIASSAIWKKHCDKVYIIPLQAKPGQKINIQLLDFGWNDILGHAPMIYGYLLDMSIINITGGGGVRKNHIYKSRGHQVEIAVNPFDMNFDNFLIYYEADGCPTDDIDPPEHSEVSIRGNYLDVSCKYASFNASLLCQGNTWEGLSDIYCPPSQTGVQEVRLSQTWHGRVEIQYNNTIGSVCDDNWTDENCKVVCKQLKYRGGEAFCCAKYGQGTGPIWLDHVDCDGTEEHLHQCKHNNFGVNNCDHSEDASCRCQDPDHY